MLEQQLRSRPSHNPDQPVRMNPDYFSSSPDGYGDNDGADDAVAATGGGDARQRQRTPEDEDRSFPPASSSPPQVPAASPLSSARAPVVSLIRANSLASKLAAQTEYEKQLEMARREHFLARQSATAKNRSVYAPSGTISTGTADAMPSSSASTTGVGAGEPHYSAHQQAPPIRGRAASASAAVALASAQAPYEDYNYGYDDNDKDNGAGGSVGGASGYRGAQGRVGAGAPAAPPSSRPVDETSSSSEMSTRDRLRAARLAVQEQAELERLEAARKAAFVERQSLKGRFGRGT